MANGILDTIGRGLRGAGGIIDPNVRAQQIAEEEYAARRDQDMQKFVLQGIMSGAMDPSLAEQFGLPPVQPTLAVELARSKARKAEKTAKLKEVNDQFEAGKREASQEIANAALQSGAPMTPEAIRQNAMFSGNAALEQRATFDPEFGQPKVAKTGKGFADRQTDQGLMRIYDDPDREPELILAGGDPIMAAGGKGALSARIIEAGDGSMVTISGSPENPVITPLTLNGEPLTSGTSARGAAVAERSAERLAAQQKRFDRSFAFKEQQAAIKEDRFTLKYAQDELKLDVEVVNKLGDDYSRDTKTLSEVGRSLDSLDAIFSKPDLSALDSVAIQRTINNVFDSGTRAMAEIDQIKNFGDVPQRLMGLWSRWVDGGYSEDQLLMVKELAQTIRDKVVIPARQNIDEFYRNKAKAFEQDPNLISAQLGREDVARNRFSAMNRAELAGVDLGLLSGAERDQLSARFDELGL